MAPHEHYSDFKNERDGVAAHEEAVEQRSFDSTIAGAKAATEKEHKMTLREGLRIYPKAVAWSLLISCLICYEGYAVALLNNLYAFPPFKQKYGELQPNGSYEIPARWQAGLSNGANVGALIGLLINGWFSERFGYRLTALICVAWIAAITAVFFTAQNVETLLVAEILCGIPLGALQTLVITYASEVAPVALRGYLTTAVNAGWGVGQLIAIGVIKAMFGRSGSITFRLPFALQWMWAPWLFVGICFAPESPWWLVRKNRLEDAKKSLLRLTSRNHEKGFDADETVSMMVHTTALEKRLTHGASYRHCFRGVDLRRTEIVCFAYAIQNTSGNAFSNYSTYFLTQAGVPASASYNFAAAQYSLNIIGVFGAWILMGVFGLGRRALYIYGLCALSTLLLAMGLLGLVPTSHKTEAGLATGSLMIIWAACYQLSIGSVVYSLVAELSTRRLQIKTVVLGRCLYNIVGIITSVLTPYMLNPTAWNWGNYTGFFWSGLAFLSLVYIYFRLPEPQGRSFAELDLLFEKKISARKFAKTEVDVFAESVDDQIMGGSRRAYPASRV